jgi:sugar phosphate isomerase/epimerase
MLREVDRANVGLCLDAPLFHERQSDADMREAVLACGDHILLTHFGAWNFSETAAGLAARSSASATCVIWR